MRVAVIGHVEVVEFVRVPQVPRAGEIAHASETWEEPAGGGAVAAAQLAKLAGKAALLTALGDDALGKSVPARLAAMNVVVRAAWRQEPQRRAITFIDDHAERTITVIGARHQPEPTDELPWDALSAFDAIYFTAGDPEVLRRARAARVLVATARVLPIIEAAGVKLDAIVRSAVDPGEPDPRHIAVPPRLSVATEGARGGFYVEEGRRGRYDPVDPPGPLVDAYGCGDSFAAGLTFALGVGKDTDDALAFAARCGAACATGRGPYERQWVLSDDERAALAEPPRLTRR